MSTLAISLLMLLLGALISALILLSLHRKKDQDQTNQILTQQANLEQQRMRIDELQAQASGLQGRIDELDKLLLEKMERINQQDQELAVKRERLQGHELKLSEQAQTIEQQGTRIESHAETIRMLNATRASLEATLNELKETVERERNEHKERIELARSEYRKIQEENSRLAQDRTRLDASVKNALENEAKQKALFDTQLKALEDRFAKLSEEITRRRSEELASTNKTQLDALLNPLKESFGKMEQAFRAGRESSAQNTGQLKEAIERIMDSAKEVGTKADALSLALRGESKTQGNWGEQILEVILEKEGFKEGIHYETQFTLKDKQGRLLRPDAIVHYPDKRILIIDAKVSLTDYVAYHNATDEEGKNSLRKKHYQSVEKHVKELAEKQYYKYIDAPYSTIDYVVMFMPISGSLELALEENPNLWHLALQRGIFIATEHTLLILMKMIGMVWRQYDQETNIQQIILEAENLLKQTTNFLFEYEKLGEQIEKLQSAHADARKKIDGRQGIFLYAKRIEKLGVENKSNKRNQLAALNQEISDAEDITIYEDPQTPKDDLDDQDKSSIIG